MFNFIYLIVLIVVVSCGKETTNDGGVILPDEKIELIKEKAKEPEKKTSKEKKTSPVERKYPDISLLEEFQELEINSRYEHNYNIDSKEVALKSWDFMNNCDGCLYDIPFIKDVRIFEISSSELLVWQKVVKKLWIFSLESETFFYARQFRNSEGTTIIIDLETLSEESLEKIKEKTGLNDSRSFEKLKLRSTITSNENGSHILSISSGTGRGLTAKVPHSILINELRKTSQIVARAIE